MSPAICLGCILLLFYFKGQTVSICQDAYFYVCNGNEMEFDTTEDFEEIYCDCQEVTHCCVVELSEECNSTVIRFNSSADISDSKQLDCDISPLESQTEIPAYELLNHTKNQVFVRIKSEYDFGKYKIFCNFVEIDVDPNMDLDQELEIVFVIPAEVFVDVKTKLELTVAKQNSVNLPVWCFVKTPDNNIEALSALWISDIQIECAAFSPMIPGVFKISLSSTQIASSSDKSISVMVNSKHPIAQDAEYSTDFKTILIYFDGNIELNSNCASVFSKETSKNFGINFDCFVKGNVLLVKMGSQFQLTNTVSVSSENKICRAGSQAAGMCLPALPANLNISKPKISGPNLSFVASPTCETNSSQKHMTISVLPSKLSSLTSQNQTARAATCGKIQRKNLMKWKILRQIQSKISRSAVIEMNATEVLPVFENLQSVERFMSADETNLDVEVKVSVFVQPSPSSSSVVAEVSVSFCRDRVKTFRYRWFVNGDEIFSDGKLVIVDGLTPGMYVIKCVVESPSGEIYGQVGKGWTTAELIHDNERVIVIPSEITLGTTDDLFLRAISWHGSSVSWTCRTALGRLCFTSSQILVSDVFDLNSVNISIPAGTLPAGHYVWTAGNVSGSNTAKVLVKSERAVNVRVDVFSAFVKSSEAIVLRGVVNGTQPECRAWWSSVRQKGFNYVDLQTVEEGKEIPNKEPGIIPLVIASTWDKNSPSDILYMFKLQVFCPKRSLDYITVPLSVSIPPRVSPIIVEPLTGKAMITEFVVSGAEANVTPENYPLLFEWRYVDSCKKEVPIKRGAFSRIFTVYLPPGDLKLMAQICDGKELCTTVESPKIRVIQGSEFPTENFRNARNQISHLMTSGDTLEGFGLATTVFKSLAVVAEPEVREEVYSTVGEAILTRIRHLERRMESDPKAVKTSLKLFERAVAISKYFRKGFDILTQLTEFENTILSRMDSKRAKV